ncbi:MAG: hypothetical protein ISS56_09665 [Anaerolineae bacterium]|nr:hypothetical protein [Anaerolineae bacterium]
MLMDRIIKVLTFRREVYAEVERDTEFTNTAWLLVVVVSLLAQIGKFSSFGFGAFGKWLIAAIVGTILAVLGFAVGCMVISAVGKALFRAEVSFEEMVRTLGLAYVWNIIGVFGILAAVAPALACVLTPVIIIAAIVGLVSWLFAAKEALDLDWGPTAITLIIGWIVTFVITLIASPILGLLGLTAA